MNYIPAIHQNPNLSVLLSTGIKLRYEDCRFSIGKNRKSKYNLVPSRARKTTHIPFIRGSKSRDTSQHGPKRNQPHLYQISHFPVKENPARLPLFVDEIVQMHNLFTQIDRFSKTLIL